MSDNHTKQIKELIKVCHWLNANGLSPATSGNYSIRKDQQTCFVSASGVDKGNLKVSDFIEYGLDYSFDAKEKKPSDESPIHSRIYSLHPEAGCILHAHSIVNTVIGQINPASQLKIKGLEMQKAFTGIMTHESSLEIQIVDNSQDTLALAKSLGPFSLPCFILRGHGVYVWGENVSKAKRHLEGLEFLLACQYELMKWERKV